MLLQTPTGDQLRSALLHLLLPGPDLLHQLHLFLDLPLLRLPLRNGRLFPNCSAVSKCPHAHRLIPHTYSVCYSSSTPSAWSRSHRIPSASRTGSAGSSAAGPGCTSGTAPPRSETRSRRTRARQRRTRSTCKPRTESVSRSGDAALAGKKAKQGVWHSRGSHLPVHPPIRGFSRHRDVRCMMYAVCRIFGGLGLVGDQVEWLCCGVQYEQSCTRESNDVRSVVWLCVAVRGEL